MKMTEKQYETIKGWMYRNARPIDITRWKYHFENGSKEDVLTALSAYQNPDGGFGHALEADCWNPNSSPAQTLRAAEILYELEIEDKDNSIVKNILNYLDSKKGFRDGYWLAEIPTNNEYPHAKWWTYRENVIAEWGYNPTICLVGFILYFADKDTELYKSAFEIAKKAVGLFLQKENPEDADKLLCFIRFSEYCKKAGIADAFPKDEMISCLKKKVKSLITKDKKTWKYAYVCRPSQFMITPDSIFYPDNKELSDYETEFIIKTMSPDGTWRINWSWDYYMEEWSISKNWWKANQILINLRYLKGYGCL